LRVDLVEILEAVNQCILAELDFECSKLLDRYWTKIADDRVADERVDGVCQENAFWCISACFKFAREHPCALEISCLERASKRLSFDGSGGPHRAFAVFGDAIACVGATFVMPSVWRESHTFRLFQKRVRTFAQDQNYLNLKQIFWCPGRDLNPHSR